MTIFEKKASISTQTAQDCTTTAATQSGIPKGLNIQWWVRIEILTPVPDLAPKFQERERI